MLTVIYKTLNPYIRFTDDLLQFSWFLTCKYFHPRKFKKVIQFTTGYYIEMFLSFFHNSRNRICVETFNKIIYLHPVKKKKMFLIKLPKIKDTCVQFRSLEIL